MDDPVDRVENEHDLAPAADRAAEDDEGPAAAAATEAEAEAESRPGGLRRAWLQPVWSGLARLPWAWQRPAWLGPAWARWRPRLRHVGFALAGALLALALVGRVKAQIGPFDATVAARPSFSGQTTVRLAPLGTIVLDTHDVPVALDLRADQIGLREAQAIAENPEVINARLGDEVAEDVRSAMIRLAWRCALVALIGALLGALVAHLTWKSALFGTAAGGLLVVAIGGGTAVTFDANAVSEPRYTGLLRAAPAAVGDIETIIDRYGEYRAQLSDLVNNVVTLYLTAESLPVFEAADDTIRVLHVSDIHLNPHAFDLIEQVNEQFAIDAVVDTGDLVDWGTAPEERLVSLIGDLDVPYVYVRGNHDSHRIQQAVADEPNAVVLDGDAAEVAGLRFWGVGDPRYTPNKDQPEGQGTEQEQAEAFAPEVAERLADDEPPEVDVVLIHDERAAGDLGGQVPLVLAGHTHEARQDRIDPPDEESTTTTAGDESDRSDVSDDEEPEEPEETVLMVSGSTGGAGLRGLQGQEPEPLEATVLYFDPESHRLLAYDRIILQGFGETGATIERHVLVQPEEEEPA